MTQEKPHILGVNFILQALQTVDTVRMELGRDPEGSSIHRPDDSLLSLTRFIIQTLKMGPTSRVHLTEVQI